MSFKQIFGVVMLIIILVTSIKSDKRTKEIKKELNQRINENPSQKEKIKVIKSLVPSLAEPEEDSKQILLILVIILYSILILFFLLVHYNVEYEIIADISTSIAIFLIFLLFFGANIKAKKFKKHIKNTFIQQYGDIKEDKHFQSLDMDQKNNFCFKILKYKCIVNNYTEKRVGWDDASWKRSKSIIKVKNVFEYYYNLKVLGVKNISVSLLTEESIKDSINKLSQTKLIKVKIIGDYLFVSKTTVLHGYNKEDAATDIRDVELFYNEIVKKILDKNTIS